VQLFNPDDTDFRTTITKIRKRGYDALGVFLLNDQVVTFYHQAATLQYTPQTFGAAIHDNQQLITRAGPTSEGAFFVGYDVQPEFEARWRKEFNDTSMIGVSANAFDTAVVIAELYGDGISAKLSAEQIIDRLRGISERRGVSGTFSFADSADAGKHIDFPLSLRIVQNGEIRSGPRP
jgi:ABC-type branched-subunit amino acid transport system substrate-binding protein